eukprot:scaffold94228_cov63-Phaeocystis_antarctica.AAC.1
MVDLPGPGVGLARHLLHLVEDCDGGFDRQHLDHGTRDAGRAGHASRCAAEGCAGGGADGHSAGDRGGADPVGEGAEAGRAGGGPPCGQGVVFEPSQVRPERRVQGGQAVRGEQHLLAASVNRQEVHGEAIEGAGQLGGADRFVADDIVDVGGEALECPGQAFLHPRGGSVGWLQHGQDLVVQLGTAAKSRRATREEHHFGGVEVGAHRLEDAVDDPGGF